MSDSHLSFRPHPDERPGDDEAREARHQVLATLLGAYADGELPPETVAQIDAHLLGCARCRREVEVHRALRVRLQREPVPSASREFRERLAARLATQAASSAPAPDSVATVPWWRSRRVRLAGLVFAAALGAGAFWFTPRATPDAARSALVEAASVPLLDEVLADYRDVMSRDLPGRARDLDAVRAAVPFPVQPLSGDGVRLLAAWSTDIQGEPAAVLAYRWHDALVLQYLVSEPLFFRHASLRAPVASGAAVTAVNGAQGLVAWAEPQSGAIVVGDAPPAGLLTLRVAARTR